MSYNTVCAGTEDGTLGRNKTWIRLLHIYVRLSYNTIYTNLLITLQIPCSCPLQVFQGLASKRSYLAYERADFLKKKNL